MRVCACEASGSPGSPSASVPAGPAWLSAAKAVQLREHHKVLASDGTFTVDGDVLGTGHWLSATRYVVRVQAWGNIWWIGEVQYDAAGRFTGMMTSTVRDEAQASTNIPKHFESGSVTALIEPSSVRWGEQVLVNKWTEAEARQIRRIVMAILFSLALLILGLIWGVCEREKRRAKAAASTGGYPLRAGHYLSGLLECIGYPAICIPAFFFTPVAAAFNRAEADHRECSVCDACCSFKTPLTQYHTRQSIRAANRLEEAQLEDCITALCCTTCAVGQDTLELQRRAELQPGAPAPPGVHVAMQLPAVHVAMPASAGPEYKEGERMQLTKADPTDQV